MTTEPLLDVDTYNNNDQNYFRHFIFLWSKTVFNSGPKAEALFLSRYDSLIFNYKTV